MFRRGLLLLSCLTMLISGGRVFCQEQNRERTLGQVRQLEIRRLMNLFKKAPQEDVSHQAIQELYRLGVEHQDIATAIVLDHHLLDRDEKVRYRTSMLLARGKPFALMVAARNLRNLIAAETNPDLIWTHAVALSSIDPSAGSALELIQSIEHDPIVRKALWDEKAQEKQAIALGSLSTRLRLKKNQPPGQGGTASGQVTHANPSATVDDAKSREEKLLESFGIESARMGAEEPTYRYDFDVANLNPAPPPPPQKIPAHPLIAAQRFDEILDLMDQHSEEAWELFRLFGDSFPAEKVAPIYVPRAMSDDVRKRGLAMKALWYAGPDAQLAAALCYAVSHDLCPAHQVEMLERIEQPGPYSEETIRRLRKHDNPRVRKAVLEAMARTPAFKELLLADLKSTLNEKDPAHKIAAIEVVAEHKGEWPETRSPLQEVLLREDDLRVLREASRALWQVPADRKFQRKIFQRIDADRLADTDLILLQYLLRQIAEESQTGKELEDKIQDSLFKLDHYQTWIKLAPELREMIKQVEAIKEQSQLEALEQLTNLKLLD